MASSTFQMIMDTVKDAAANVNPSQIEQFTGHRIDTVDEFMRKTEHTGPKNYGRGFLAGVLGGLVGVGVKMLVDRAMAPDTVQFEDKLADDIVDSAEEMTGINLDAEDEAAAAAIIEVGIGALIGGVYGLIVEAMPEANTDKGAPLWTAAQQFAVPALGFAPTAVKDVAADKIENLAGHVAFGTTVEVVRRATRYYMEQR
ncbi:hypothetical protein [Neolewinella persica]|uniref:hypothetical protein n=1 Tax=Neolewinella persica TaxID=70998 RepID=UPI00036857E1|nr:hypothetical protein [Neolewinella persica]